MGVDRLQVGVNVKIHGDGDLPSSFDSLQCASQRHLDAVHVIQVSFTTRFYDDVSRKTLFQTLPMMHSLLASVGLLNETLTRQLMCFP